MAKDFVETLLSLSKPVEGLNFLRFPRDISSPLENERKKKENKEKEEASVSYRFRPSIYPNKRANVRG